MKVTLGHSSYMAPANDHSSAPKNSLLQDKIKYHPANQHATQRTDQQWRATHVASWARWASDQPGFAPANKFASELSNLITVKKVQSLSIHSCSSDLTASQALETTSTFPAQTADFLYSESPDIWLFCSAAQKLCNNSICIQLTTIESLLIKTLTLREERICSKQELVIGINKDPHNYSGLEMCLSRLQSKFRDAFGERLFRSVRNRWYCLVQDVRVAG